MSRQLPSKPGSGPPPGGRTPLESLERKSLTGKYDQFAIIARRDGLNISKLRAGRRSESGIPGGLNIRLDCRAT
ncbi:MULTISPECIES: hypothetical protein [Streptomyces]|uniref:hypothetical protein n=1 Tax=Streptomyces TaxID=1883 RepID=UPI00343D591A